MHCIWEVIYKSGRVLNQCDSTAPEFKIIEGDPLGGEVPYNKIDWEQVDKLVFYNMEGVGQQYDVLPVDPGLQISLRKRSWINPSKGTTACFVFLVSKKGEPVNKESVVASLYWFPDFTDHVCTEFDCPEVNQWVMGQLTNKRYSLPAVHAAKQVNVDAILT